MKIKRFDYLVRQNIGDPGFIKLRKVFPLISVLPKLPQLPYGVKKHLFHVPLFFPGHKTLKKRESDIWNPKNKK